MTQASKQALESIRKAAKKAKLGKKRASKDEDQAALLRALGLLGDDSSEVEEDEDTEEAAEA